ncbi:hypothetical protein ACIF8T_36090 [Streptomyces sp. NPDC085946]|uniref:hypothetical protein n=1 Tax=Streptomyces sp. NPDC085946 TaxID=3365744 RepID=UPI0037D40397
MTIDRRPLGTGPLHMDDPTAEAERVPRARLAAERLPTVLPAPTVAPRPTGRRVLGAAPDA